MALKVWLLRYYKGREPVLCGQYLPLKCRLVVFLKREWGYLPCSVPNRLLWSKPRQ